MKSQRVACSPVRCRHEMELPSESPRGTRRLTSTCLEVGPNLTKDRSHRHSRCWKKRRQTNIAFFFVTTFVCPFQRRYGSLCHTSHVVIYIATSYYRIMDSLYCTVGDSSIVGYLWNSFDSCSCVSKGNSRMDFHPQTREGKNDTILGICKTATRRIHPEGS